MKRRTSIPFGCWLLAFLFFPALLPANNLRISEVSCSKTSLKFTIAWDNGWNLGIAPNNHDAVWVFAKIRGLTGKWMPLLLSPSFVQHQVSDPGQLSIQPAFDGVGAMIRNVGQGAGHVPEIQVELALQQPLPPGFYDIRVFGIEMAHVPEGAFWLGDGASNFALHNASNGQPYQVSSEDEIPQFVLSADSTKDPGGDIPEAFPKGYNGFYLMKYELSQEQYVDFLNTLTLDQQRNRTANPPDTMDGALALTTGLANRNGIVLRSHGHAGQNPGTYACNLDGGSPNGDYDGQTRACNWMSWMDVAAYLDWAGLRPMTELEFEKACRGPIYPIAKEFAWGTDSVVDANTVLLDGTEAEQVLETGTDRAGLASHGYDGPTGPLRCGFTGNSGVNRVGTGAGYYGNMELSGNLWEFCVSVYSAGLGFNAICGDGMLTDAGEANVPTWPGPAGVGFRGGAWNSGILPGFRDLAVSDRFYIDWLSDIRRNTAGGRGAR